MNNLLKAIFFFTSLLMLGCVTPPTEKLNEQVNSSKVNNQKPSNGERKGNRNMMPIIIFATIVINGEVENWQYYKVRQGFATEKDCYEYMEKNGKTVRKELETRMQAKNPNSRLLVLGCSDRKTFAEE